MVPGRLKEALPKQVSHGSLRAVVLAVTLFFKISKIVALSRL